MSLSISEEVGPHLKPTIPKNIAYKKDTVLMDTVSAANGFSVIPKKSD